MLPVIRTDTTKLHIATWALGTCGLNSLQRHFFIGEQKLDFLEKHPEYGQYDGSGNFLFSVSSHQLQHPSGLTAKLLEHKNCRIIHWYKNNAHGPNLVFICMIHVHPKAVNRPDHKNNVKEYQDRLAFENGEYILK